MKRILLAALFFLATFARFYAIDSIGLHDWDVGWMISNAKNLLRPNHHITSHFGTSVIFAFTRLFSESDTAVLVTVALFDLAILALTFSFANRFFSFWVAFFSVLFLSLFPRMLLQGRFQIEP